MRRPQARWLAGLVGVVLASVVSPALAGMADNLPPVTVADEVTVLPGGSTYVDVMANDSDDLGQQALCRARGSSDVEATVDRGKVFVNVPTDQPGDYQVQYQTCDYDYLTLGALTVHAVTPVPVTVHKVAGQPGVLHATNPNPVRVVLLWAGPRGEHLDGHLSLRAGAGKDFTVTRHHILWAAVDPSSYWEEGSWVGGGEVRHIDLPSTTRQPSPAATDRRLTALWHLARSGRASGRHPVPGGAAAPWPSDPTTVQPPVPHTDTIHWWSGSWDRVHVTKNDVDPQGQGVDVCRLSPEAIAPPIRSVLTPSVLDGQLDVGTSRRASGTVELPYYVCNSGRLAPALLRVVLVKARPLQVRRLARDPHLVRVHNPNPARVTYTIGRPHVDIVWDRLAAHATWTLRVPLNAHHWEGFIGPHAGYAGSGRIRLP